MKLFQIRAPFEVADAIGWIRFARNQPALEMLRPGRQLECLRWCGIELVDPRAQSIGVIQLVPVGIRGIRGIQPRHGRPQSGLLFARAHVALNILESALYSNPLSRYVRPMSDLVKVAEVADLQPGEGKTVVVGDRELALFNVGGQFHCIDNFCPHRGGSLGEGVLNDKIVACPLHGWRFDVTTGQSPVIPAAKVDTFEVVVTGADVKVRI